VRWVAIFDDNDGAAEIRKRHSAAHLEYLEANSHVIRLAGGLRPSPDEWYCGALWVLEVESRDQAVEIIENDPFFVHGLRKGYRLLVWGKAPCYGTVQL